MNEPRQELDESLAVATERPKTVQPPLYKVVMLNDDYTPMEFVVQVLQAYFRMERDKAVQIMLQVHTQGRAVVGIFTRDIAETKVAQVNDYSRKHQHPLLCQMEAA